MKVKKKFMIAMASLISVLALSVIAIVAIFAAMNNSVQSGLTVRYTAVDVSATVKANYIVGSTRIPMVTESGEDEIVFRPTAETNASFTPPESDEIELSTSNDFVVFEYIFTNDSNSIDVAIDLDATAFSVTNMDISYAYSYDRIRNVATMPTTNSFEPMMILGEDIEGGFYETLYVYVKVTVSNLANDAFFEGNMDFSLTKAIPMKLEFKNIDGATNSVLLQTRIIPSNVEINGLPAPIFTDGKVYCWYKDAMLETMLDRTFSTSEDMIVYAGIAPYVIEVADDEASSKITNLLDTNIYVHTYDSRRFSYGARVYKSESSEGYVILKPGQSVTFSGVLASKSVKLKQPSNWQTRCFYIANGEYPQTYVGSELNEELINSKLTETGKTYTAYSNGSERILIEYSYKGKTYVKLEDSSYNGTNVTFLNGEFVENDKTYFFHVEPIVSRVYEQNEDGSYTTMALDIIGSRRFNALHEGLIKDDIYDRWEDSIIREYLNGVFLNESGLLNIVTEQNIKNNDAGIYYDSDDNITSDKIWIASVEEILKWSGSGSMTDEIDAILSEKGGNYTDACNNNRGVQQSDLATATAAYWYEGNGRYYLRSSGNLTEVWHWYEEYYSYNHDNVCRVNAGGNIYSEHSVFTDDTGFRPVFAVMI